MTTPRRPMELLTDKTLSTKPFPISDADRDAARRAVAAHVVRNDHRSTDDELRDRIAELLDVLGLVEFPAAPRPRRR